MAAMPPTTRAVSSTSTISPRAMLWKSAGSAVKPDQAVHERLGWNAAHAEQGGHRKAEAMTLKTVAHRAALGDHAVDDRRPAGANQQRPRPFEGRRTRPALERRRRQVAPKRRRVRRAHREHVHPFMAVAQLEISRGRLEAQSLLGSAVGIGARVLAGLLNRLIDLVGEEPQPERAEDDEQDGHHADRDEDVPAGQPPCEGAERLSGSGARSRLLVWCGSASARSSHRSWRASTRRRFRPRRVPRRDRCPRPNRAVDRG